MMAYIENIDEELDVVIVPSQDDMNDETFLKHLEKRHPEECRFESTPVARLAMKAWMPSYRAYHRRLHQVNEYDHEHEDDL